MQNDGYIREQEIIEKTEIEKEADLIRTIIKTREQLKVANCNFEYAKDDLVDYYTYQIKANQAKLDYLIKVAKTKGIEVDMINDIKFTLWDDGEEAGGDEPGLHSEMSGGNPGRGRRRECLTTMSLSRTHVSM